MCAAFITFVCVKGIYGAWKGRRCQWEEIKEVNNLIKNAPLHTRSSFALLWLHGRLFYKHFCSHFLTLVDIFFLGVCNEIDLLLPGLRFHNYFWLNIPCITRLLFLLASLVTETGKQEFALLTSPWLYCYFTNLLHNIFIVAVIFLQLRLDCGRFHCRFCKI